MSQLLANTTTVTRRSRVWALIEALAYAGAVIDPSGIMAVQRLRRAEAEEARNGRR
jgi:hypothetical protein